MLSQSIRMLPSTTSFGQALSRVQVHADLLNFDEAHFLDQYPVGKTFRMELTVRVIDENQSTEPSAQVGTVN